jgi:hypothetical protein
VMDLLLNLVRLLPILIDSSLDILLFLVRTRDGTELL